MFEFRAWNKADAEIILSWIDNESDFRKWSADRYKDYPAKPSDMISMYEDISDAFRPMTMTCDGKVVGHIILRYPDETKTTVRLGFVIVDSSVRGKGYGKKLLNMAIDYAKEKMNAKQITLGVFENNLPAYNCYKAVGFEDVLMPETEYFNVMGQKWKCLELIYKV